jgi:hypothetical protein
MFVMREFEMKTIFRFKKIAVCVMTNSTEEGMLHVGPNNEGCDTITEVGLHYSLQNLYQPQYIGFQSPLSTELPMPHPTINRLGTVFNGVRLGRQIERPVEGAADHL